jgi:hypothetical protein
MNELKIKQNSARCRKCGDIICSVHVHDFNWCKCGAIAVDGGLEYLKRVGDLENIEELSVLSPGQVKSKALPATVGGMKTCEGDV